MRLASRRPLRLSKRYAEYDNFHGECQRDSAATGEHAKQGVCEKKGLKQEEGQYFIGRQGRDGMDIEEVPL